MALSDNVVVFVVSLLVGGIGIHVGASLLASSRDYSHAVVTAALGALVWGVVGWLVGGIPVVGPVATLLSYLLVVRSRYRVGWTTAAGISLVAWVASVVVLSVLASADITSASAVGVPFI